MFVDGKLEKILGDPISSGIPQVATLARKTKKTERPQWLPNQASLEVRLRLTDPLPKSDYAFGFWTVYILLINNG